MSNEIMAVSYTANDGSAVSLTAADVVRYCAPGAMVTEQECAMFLGVCKARGLNPFARDCYLVKYQDNPASIITSKDYFTRTAAAQPTFDGHEAGIIVLTKAGLEYRDGSFFLNAAGETLVGGWATVHDKRRAHPCKAAVALSEYSTGRSLWRSKPATMIRKVALVQALREAYPERFQGLYDRDEMGEAGEQARDAELTYEVPAPTPAPVAEDAPVEEFPDAPQGPQNAPGAPVDEAAAPMPRSRAISPEIRAELASLAASTAEAAGITEADARRAIWDACKGGADERAMRFLAAKEAQRLARQAAPAPGPEAVEAVADAGTF